MIRATDSRQLQELADLGARAFLVGTALMKSEDPRETLRNLQGFL